MVALVAVAGAGAVAANWVLNVWHDTPDIARLRPKPQGSISTVYAADGTRLGFISSDTLRRKVRAGDISGRLKRATVDIEDRRFYQHGGVDYLGILRAAAKNLSADRAQQGGSTLTMQLVRNLYTPRVRFRKTLRRKIAEAKLADELDKRHSKRWILTQYLNNVPYGTVGGQTAIGIGAAARVFFDTTPSRLTLPGAGAIRCCARWSRPATCRRHARSGRVGRGSACAGTRTTSSDVSASSSTTSSSGSSTATAWRRFGAAA